MGKGGINDKVLSPAVDKEFYPTNPMASSGLTSTKIFGFLNADDKDYVTLEKYLDEFPDVKREANYQEISSSEAGVSQRVKNAQFLGEVLANNEKRKQDAENDATGMSLVKGITIGATAEFALGEIFLAEEGAAEAALSKTDKFLESANAADRNGLTKAGRALQKHINRAGSSFSDLTYSGKTANNDAIKVIDDILGSENKLIEPLDNGTLNIFDKGSGKGLNISRNGEFNGFRDIKEKE